MIKINNKLLFFFISGIFMLMLSGCASKRFVRTASKYEQSGMFRLAVDNYIASLEKKNIKNDDARIGLMRSAKRYSDELELIIDDVYAALKDDRVVAYYMEFQKLKNQAAVYNVDVDISHKTQGQFDESKHRHLRLTYTRAQEMLDNERFVEAENLLAEVIKIDRNYERAGELYAFSRCEPIYREARRNMEAKLYRSAYYAFSRLLSLNSAYKDAQALQREALQYAILTIAVQPIKNAYNHPFLANQIIEATRQGFVRNTHPFVKLVSTDYAQKMLEEQRFALANNLPFDASLVIPVRVYLSGSIISSQYSTSRVKKTERKAYFRHLDKNRQLQYKKVLYYEHEQTANATMQYGYEFIRVENGIILTSDDIRKSYSDRVFYARSEYDVKSLFPGDWGTNVKDTMYTDNARIQAMRQLFDARSVLTDKQGFESAFAATVASELYKKISAYDPEK
jgi:hypothetical protein